MKSYMDWPLEGDTTPKTFPSTEFYRFTSQVHAQVCGFNVNTLLHKYLLCTKPVLNFTIQRGFHNNDPQNVCASEVKTIRKYMKYVREVQMRRELVLYTKDRKLPVDLCGFKAAVPDFILVVK